jgi:hypothetical protein
MHDQYIRSEDRWLTGADDSLLWLSTGDIKGETESKITAAQGQALRTKYHVNNTLHRETGSTFRLYQQFGETVEQIMSAFPVLADELHIKIQHTELHCSRCKETGGKLYNQHRYHNNVTNLIHFHFHIHSIVS